MAKKNLWLGILALVLVFGMTVVGCEEDEPEEEEGITIELSGITGHTGKVGIALYSSFDSSTPDVAGAGTISGGTVTVADSKWSGSGTYYVLLLFETSSKLYAYTGGSALDKLGIFNGDDLTKLPKKTFTLLGPSTTYHLYFKDFVDISDL
jgi:hypothetical protein